MSSLPHFNPSSPLRVSGTQFSFTPPLCYFLHRSLECKWPHLSRLDLKLSFSETWVTSACEATLLSAVSQIWAHESRRQLSVIIAFLNSIMQKSRSSVDIKSCCEPQYLLNSVKVLPLTQMTHKSTTQPTGATIGALNTPCLSSLSLVLTSFSPSRSLCACVINHLNTQSLWHNYLLYLHDLATLTASQPFIIYPLI